MKNIEFKRKICVMHSDEGDYAILSLPKKMFDHWQESNVDFVRMRYVKDRGELTVKPF